MTTDEIRNFDIYLGSSLKEMVVDTDREEKKAGDTRLKYKKRNKDRTKIGFGRLNKKHFIII